MAVMREASESAGAGDRVVVVRVGAAGGDVTLVGREGSNGSWQFMRVTEDQSERMLGEAETSTKVESGWVDSWKAAIGLMDRYPWAMLHALEVHEDFAQRVGVAVETRLARQEPSRHVERARKRWERVLSGAPR